MTVVNRYGPTLRTNTGSRSQHRSCYKGQCEVKCMAKLVSQAKAIIKFLSIDRVTGIVEVAVKELRCTSVPKTSILMILLVSMICGRDDGGQRVENKPFLVLSRGSSRAGNTTRRAPKIPSRNRSMKY
jgi:hypothetical protein